MMRPTPRQALAACATLVLLGASLPWVLRAGTPAPSGVSRTVLLRQDSSIAGREAILLNVELAPGAAEGRHTHAAEAYGFVLEGNPTLEKDGSAPVTMHAGEAFVIPAGLVHEGRNPGKSKAHLAVVMLAEKGKPLTTPAP
ncbi:MAG: cupin domain-containing protein [Steroidobacteraceae bacterium]